MSSKNVGIEVGIEEARKTLGYLITAARQGADIVITRNGKPAARIARHEEPTMITPTYCTVDMLNQDRAWYLVGTVTGESGGVRAPSYDGTVVILSGGDLELLAKLPDDCDGHYDGTYVWIGGSEYPVSRSA